MEWFENGEWFDSDWFSPEWFATESDPGALYALIAGTSVLGAEATATGRLSSVIGGTSAMGASLSYTTTNPPAELPAEFVGGVPLFRARRRKRKEPVFALLLELDE